PVLAVHVEAGRAQTVGDGQGPGPGVVAAGGVVADPHVGVEAGGAARQRDGGGVDDQVAPEVAVDVAARDVQGGGRPVAVELGVVADDELAPGPGAGQRRPGD